jgi:hypothetical protein
VKDIVIIIIVLKSIWYIFISINALIYKINLRIFKYSLNYRVHYIFLIFGLLLAISAVLLIMEIKSSKLLINILMYCECVYLAIALIYLAWLRSGRLGGRGSITLMHFLYLLLLFFIDICIAD